MGQVGLRALIKLGETGTKLSRYIGEQPVELKGLSIGALALIRQKVLDKARYHEECARRCMARVEDIEVYLNQLKGEQKMAGENEDQVTTASETKEPEPGNAAEVEAEVETTAAEAAAEAEPAPVA
jgi:hypothetical protein